MSVQQIMLTFGRTLIKSVQTFSITIATSSASNTATITSVDTTKSIIVYGGMSGSNTSTSYDTDQATLALTNSTTVTATRNTAGSPTLTIVGTVIEFNSDKISSVQSGTIVMNGVSSNTATITSVDTTRSAIFYLGAQSNGTGGNLAVNCPRITLTNATTVTATRNSTTGIVTAGYVVIEFATGITSSIQQGTVQLANVTSNTATITSVDTSRSMLVWNGFAGTSNSNAPRFMPAITLTNATTITGTRQTASTDTSDVNFTVIEFSSGVVRTVNRGVMTISTSSATQTATITAVDTSKTVAHWLGCNNSEADTSYRDNYSTVVLTNSTTVTATRNTADASSTESVGWEAIEFA